jgi:hypothetical protein
VTLRDIAIDAPRPIYDRRHGTHVLRRYSRRMRDWRAWLRLTRFQSNYSYIGRALMAAVRGGSAAGTRGTGGQMGGNDTGSAGGESVGTMSPVFFKAVKAFHQRGGRALFINSERSKTTFLFDTRFAEVYLAPGKPMHGPHEVITVAGANHTYSTPEWFDAAANAVLGWIAKDPARAERAAVV